MIGIKDLYTHYIRKPLPEDCGIICEPIDPALAILNRLLDDTLSYFSYTLVLNGEATVDHSGTKITLQPHDLMITTPGAKVVTLEVSDDFSAWCLMADEMTTYEITETRYATLASFSPLLINSPNKLHLSDIEFESIKKWMQEIIGYGASETQLTKFCLASLYTLFVCDLINIENAGNPDNNQCGHTSEIFLDFLKLLPSNYNRHHDIRFYADRLAVTPIYLSRVVKRHSGQTVKDHIDRLLLSESSRLLKRTDTPIAIIADNLNFSSPQSFCKFFVRNKGVSPRKYRDIQFGQIEAENEQ